MTTMHAPCGLIHHDAPASDASRWCAHWATHGARVLSGDDAKRMKNVQKLIELSNSSDVVVADFATGMLNKALMKWMSRR